MLRVVLADDHPILRSGLRALIDAQTDMEVVGEAADGAEALQCVLTERPDVAVVDVSMPRVSGAAVAERVAADFPGTIVLALSAYDDGSHVQRMLAAGARGYVAKRSPPEDLLRAIRAVAGGEVYLDPAVASAIVPGPVRGRPRAGAVLSERETEVLTRIAQGHAMKEIAAHLDVAVRTVETYRARAMEKLGLENRADVVRYAVERGWLGEL